MKDKKEYILPEYSHTPKTNTSIYLDRELVEEAHKERLSISRIANDALREVLGK